MSWSFRGFRVREDCPGTDDSPPVSSVPAESASAFAFGELINLQMIDREFGPAKKGPDPGAPMTTGKQTIGSAARGDQPRA